jgi:2,4-dienoyl-CoA reductase-like NADH-dependent reductase (Old Yellow Enzyme family)
MAEEDIQVVIKSFGEAARRAVEAGADGVQIHAAHGYLINEFLSPFFNRRTDAWGGSEENMFRLLKEIFGEIRSALPKGMPLMIKLNTNDHTPQSGVTPTLVRKYIQWLAEMGIDAVENSCGSGFSFMSTIRGDVPVDELAMAHTSWRKLLSRISLRGMVNKFDVYDGYNLEDSKAIKPLLEGIPVMAVGGMRKVSHMEEVLEKGYADFISICRPFIREPFLVRRIREGKTDAATCKYCNKCFAAIVHEFPLRCYYREDFRELLKKRQL